MYTPFEKVDTRPVWNLKFNLTLLSWCVFNSVFKPQIKPIASTTCNMKAESIRVCFDTLYLKVIPTLKFNPTRFFFKEESMNYFHNVFWSLTLPHQHEDDNNLKTLHEKETYICFKLFILWYYTNTVIKV